MKIQLNGDPTEIQNNFSVNDLLKSFHLNLDLHIVELNQQVLRKEIYSDVFLREGDTVELIRFMGGG